MKVAALLILLLTGRPDPLGGVVLTRVEPTFWAARINRGEVRLSEELTVCRNGRPVAQVRVVRVSGSVCLLWTGNQALERGDALARPEHAPAALARGPERVPAIPPYLLSSARPRRARPSTTSFALRYADHARPVTGVPQNVVEMARDMNRGSRFLTGQVHAAPTAEDPELRFSDTAAISLEPGIRSAVQGPAPRAERPRRLLQAACQDSEGETVSVGSAGLVKGERACFLSTTRGGSYTFRHSDLPLLLGAVQAAARSVRLEERPLCTLDGLESPSLELRLSSRGLVLGSVVFDRAGMRRLEKSLAELR